MSTMWYLIPLAIVVSLVYNASRYELPERILQRAGKWFVGMMVLMGAIFGLLFFLSTDL
jgi:hypothetical protein